MTRATSRPRSRTSFSEGSSALSHATKSDASKSEEIEIETITRAIVNAQKDHSSIEGQSGGLG